MKPVDARYLAPFVVPLLAIPAFTASSADYGDLIRETPEFERITTPKADGDDDRPRHPHHHHHYYRDYYPDGPRYSGYSSPARSGRVGRNGNFYVGVTIGESEFDYDDIDPGDASIFRIGFRPADSHLGYELSFFRSGDAEVTSLTDIDLEVDTVNLALTLNSSSDDRSRINFFGQGGIYFADTRLSGPFDSVSEDSNGFLLAVGVEVLLNRHFRLKAEAYNLDDVEDFADDRSITVINLGGQFNF